MAKRKGKGDLVMMCGKEKEKEDWVRKCGEEKGKGKLGEEVCSFSFLVATLYHPVFLFLSLCHTSSPSLPFPFSLPHFINQSSFSFFLVMKCGKEKGKVRLGDEVWQRERKRKIG
jgi:hypothetical protein